MTTARDVAKRAKVSTASVSRVLNGDLAVNEATREKVLRAVKELDYRPNRIARSLRQRSTHIVALVVDSIANPYFSELGEGVEEFLRPEGYDLFLYATNQDNRQGVIYMQQMANRMVDGIIYCANGLDVAEALSEQMRYLEGLSIPCVVAGWPLAQTDAVVADVYCGCREAVRYLISLGHRRIAFLKGPSGSYATDERFRGFVEGMKEAGLEIPASYIRQAHCRTKDAAQATAQLLALDEPPTAIFAANDQMAIGALHATYSRGLRVPDDLSVMGIDNIDYASYTTPGLSTVDVPKKTLGAAAARRLLARLRGAAPETSTVEMLRTRLVLRASCAPPTGLASPAPLTGMSRDR